MKENYKLIIDNITKYTSYEYDDFYDELNKLEQVKISKLKDSERRKQELLAYHILINELNSNNFTYNEDGKPSNDSDTYFNIAHQDNIVVIILAKSNVGISIEKIKPRVIDENTFTSSEIKKIKKSENINEEASRIRTLKKAYLKMISKKNDEVNDIEFKLNKKITCNKGKETFINKKYHSYMIGICINEKEA